jgi:membrane protein YdbS with pleckstrin-like domain
VTDLFEPVSGDWKRVSPRLATVRRISMLAVTAVVVIVTVVLIVLLPGLQWIPAAVGILAVATAAWGWLWAGRNQRSWGYAENADELLVTRGVMFKRLVAIPYGRMQFVDVEAGPLDRAYGIARVTLHTASPETAADIPGLLAADATALRNRLTELGESRGAGV